MGVGGDTQLSHSKALSGSQPQPVPAAESCTSGERAGPQDEVKILLANPYRPAGSRELTTLPQGLSLHVYLLSFSPLPRGFWDGQRAECTGRPAQNTDR